MLEFSAYSFKYDAQREPTLRNINFSVKRGEKILILGPSGSGKSTLIHCINALIPHAFRGAISGSYTLSGKNASELDIFETAKIAGTVLQDSDCQFVALSAAEDIAFAAENDCVPADELKRRVKIAAAMTGMEEHLSKQPQDLSGGQKQRVALSGVLMDNVELLLFDEPLANLDPEAGKDAIDLIDRIHRETGKTVIIVEHRLEDVLYRAVDRIVLIDKGCIAADMPPAQLLASPLLLQAGIREPLYLSALRYADIPFDASSHPEDLSQLVFDPGPLRAWSGGPPVLPPPELPPLLEIRNVCFSYGETGAGSETLHDISFSVGRGERMSLVGENGAGKSTLAGIICGFLKPSSGSVFFDGGDLAEKSIMERAEKIAYVMQNPNQMISFPMIFDETAFGLRNRGVAEGEIKDRVHEALQICGLYPFRAWPVSALSYGQKKRLSIAAILVLRPAFMIMDEPTAGQDYRHYRDFMEFLKKLNADTGLSLLLITHDMHLMLEYTPRAAVLAGGRCIAVKESAQILTDDAIIREARLKRTSLFDLAVRAGIEDKVSFVRRFIARENLQ